MRGKMGHLSLEFVPTNASDAHCSSMCKYRLTALKHQRFCLCSKKTLFRSTIENNTKQLMTTAYEDWIATARKWMEDPIPVHPETPKSCFDDAAYSTEFAHAIPAQLPLPPT